MTRLQTYGKPIRALRALADTDPGQPLTEHGVWLVARRSSEDSTRWHAPLATLVKHGLAVRTGRQGGFEWYITEAGREVLSEL